MEEEQQAVPKPEEDEEIDSGVAQVLEAKVPVRGIATRRQFIQLGLGVLGVGVAGQAGWIALKALEPGAEAAPQPVDVEVGDIPVGGSKDFLYGNDPAIILRSEDGFLVLSLVCTHLGCIVKWHGDEQAFRCPCHAATFDKTGRVTGGPPPAPLEKLPFKEAGNKITVGE